MPWQAHAIIPSLPGELKFTLKLAGINDLGVFLLESPQDVTPYMNPSPFTVSPNTHASQVFNLFRTMGLRHLPVVNAVGEVSPYCCCVQAEQGALRCQGWRLRF